VDTWLHGMAGVLVLCACLQAGSSPAEAQAYADRAEGRARGGIGGTVLDAGTGAPLAGATVLLQPELVGAFPAGPASGSPFAAAARAVLSDAAGTYQFDALPAGVYRIYVTRYGYRPWSVVVELRGAGVSPLGIALAAEPIPLQPLRSTAQSRGPYETGEAVGAELDMARLVVLEQRRRQFLTTDSRELTHADVVEAITLGEPDVLRALQRLPGVSTRSDYTAELWTRGAPWSHTRVYFDGVPLFNPLHALGMVSGIGSSSVGAVWFHPGVRPASMAEGAAGVIDLQSRRASGGGELNAHADVSLVSAGLALDQRVLDGRAGWMLAGRQTYLDWLTGLARRAGGDGEAAFPYGFSEVTGRVDAWLGERTAIEASGLWEQDFLDSVSERDTLAMRAEWGNSAGRVSLTARIGGLNSRHTVGGSAHDSRVMPGAWRDSWRVGQVPASGSTAWRLSESAVAYAGLTGTVWPEPATLAGPAWSAGYALDRYSARYYGPQVLPIPRMGHVPLADAPGYPATGNSRWQDALPVAAVWGERMLQAGDRLGMRLGMRIEGSPDIADAAPIRLAPRLSARYAVTSEVAVSAGVARVYQYTQALAPGGVHVASLTSTDAWLVAGPNVPAIRSDIVTLGLESWLAPGRLVTVNGFGRAAAGLAAPDPRPGRVFQRPLFVNGQNRAWGVELSARQVTGVATGSVSYTFSRSLMEAAGLTYPAAGDRRHVLSTTTMLRVSPSLRLGAAYTAATGVPFTRVIAGAEECTTEPGCDPERLPWMSVPHGERAPHFASLDLLLDWSRRLGAFEVGAWAQLRNALGRENATVFTGDAAGCTLVGCGDELRSAYERGVPRLPVLGLRVRR
jgi:hypothetical protein